MAMYWLPTYRRQRKNISRPLPRKYKLMRSVRIKWLSPLDFYEFLTYGNGSD